MRVLIELLSSRCFIYLDIKSHPDYVTLKETSEELDESLKDNVEKLRDLELEKSELESGKIILNFTEGFDS